MTIKSELPSEILEYFSHTGRPFSYDCKNAFWYNKKTGEVGAYQTGLGGDYREHQSRIEENPDNDVYYEQYFAPSDDAPEWLKEADIQAKINYFEAKGLPLNKKGLEIFEAISREPNKPLLWGNLNYHFGRGSEMDYCEVDASIVEAYLALQDV